MGGNAVQHLAHDHLRAGRGHVGVEHGGVVGMGKDCLGNILANLAGIDIHAQHEINVARAIAADPVVDQALRRIVGTIVGDPLDQRTSAIAHANHGDLDCLHQICPSRMRPNTGP